MKPKLRKSRITLLLLFLFISSAFSQELSMNPADIRAELKKIDAIKTKSLSKEPVVKRDTTDAQDENLKGQVRQVFEETETLSSPFKEQWRAITGYWEYGPDQNLIREASFDWKGGFHGVTNYGYMKGMRVTAFTTTSSGLRTTSIVGEEKKEKTGEPDPRYDLGYVYKYKNGRRSELQLFDNTGAKQNLIKYEYSGDSMAYKKFLPNGEFNEHQVYRYDSVGNEIERKAYQHGPSGVTDKYTIYVTRYDAFDSQRNWTKRSVYKVSSLDGKSVENLIRREYRTIEYFK